MIAAALYRGDRHAPLRVLMIDFASYRKVLLEGIDGNA